MLSLLPVAANLQKIVDDPQNNKNVTFKLVRTQRAHFLHGVTRSGCFGTTVSSSSRHLAWRNLKYLMMLNSLDLHSSASVKLNRTNNRGQKVTSAHDGAVVNSEKPLLPKRDRAWVRGWRLGGGRGGNTGLAGVWHYCRMHEDHNEKRLGSSQESHLKHL